jgi:hypothetical protein
MFENCLNLALFITNLFIFFHEFILHLVNLLFENIVFFFDFHEELYIIAGILSAGQLLNIESQLLVLPLTSLFILGKFLQSFHYFSHFLFAHIYGFFDRKIFVL